MLKKMLLSDFRKKKVITIALLIFIVLSSFLLSVGANSVITISKSMDTLFQVAKPPHFLQMHSGELDEKQIDSFTVKADYVKYQETVEMININSSSIWFESGKEKSGKLEPMVENQIDNGFVYQNKNFDYLVDLSNKVIEIEEGKIAVPISYKETYELQEGDYVFLKEGNYQKRFEIQCFVRDAQMGSSMSSSTRFLISKNEHEIMKGEIGELEYIVEYRFDNSDRAGEFQKLYEAEENNMPKNGVAITYPLIRLVNGLSGGLLTAVLFLISIILIMIALINLRFTILATLEEEQKEIGGLKAIGFSKKDISSIYMAKYRVYVAISCLVGFVISILGNGFFMKNIIMNFGGKSSSIGGIFVALLATCILYFIVVFYCKKIIKKIVSKTVIEILVQESGTDKKRKNRKFKIRMPLRKAHYKNINSFLGIRDLIIKRKSWSFIFIVLFFATMIILVPVNLLSTFKSPSFIENMGRPACDLGIDIASSDDLFDKYNEVEQQLQKDKRIKEYGVFETRQMQIDGEEGRENIRVEIGNYNEFEISCIHGNMPGRNGEIALSYLNAKKGNLNVGDYITLYSGEEKEKLRVCGVYQDITNGGYTAKATLREDIGNLQSYVVCANLKEKTDIDDFAKAYEKQFSYIKVIPMERCVAESFQSVIDGFSFASRLMFAVGIVIVIMITALFIKLRLAKESKKNSILRTIGFTSSEVLRQYIIQIAICSGSGVVFGIIGTKLFAEKILGSILGLLGMEIAGFSFIWDKGITFIICPILLITIAICVCYMVVRRERREWKK